MLNLNNFNIDIGTILLAVFLLIATIQMFYYWFFFSRLAFAHAKPVTNSTQPVSVIICARNEYVNLKENLPFILDQDYPTFEVVVVNDYSQDDSFFLLKSFEEKHKNFRVIHLRENVNFFEGKKLALALGIKSATHDIVLLTDADCKPSSRNWIKTMAAGFENGKDIVLGYGGYLPQKGLLNWLVRFDTLTIAMQYLSFAMAGRPYMGVGRNLAYRKSLFFKKGGFASHYKIKSGDDDLFINMASDKKNTAVVYNSNGITMSKPKTSFTTWFKQKKRHMSTGVYYRFRDKFRLGLFSSTTLLFYLFLLLIIALFPLTQMFYIAMGVFLLRVFTLLLLYYYCGKKLMEAKLFLYSPIFDLMMAVLNPIFAISNLFYRKNKWK